MKKLKGKSVLVTGAARGIGRSTAEEFGREGCRVALVDIDEAGLAEARRAVEATGAEALALVCDVGDGAAAAGAAREAEERLGGIDVLVNNAGIALSGQIKDLSREEWERIMAVNIWGPIHFLRALLPGMAARRSGHVVNISSGQAFFAAPTWGAYAATKFFLAGLSEALHYEAVLYGVGVTTVFPSVVKNTAFYGVLPGRSLAERFILSVGVPLFGVTPEKTARIIVRAVKKNKRNEFHHPAVALGYYLVRFMPHATKLAGVGAAWALTRSKAAGAAA